MILDIEVEGVDKQKDLTPPWEQFPCKDLSPNVLFSCHQEHQDALAIAGTVGADTLGTKTFFAYKYLIKVKMDEASQLQIQNTFTSVNVSSCEHTNVVTLIFAPHKMRWRDWIWRVRQ